MFKWKVAQIFLNVAQKVTTVVLLGKWHFSKKPKYSQNIWATIKRKIVDKYFEKSTNLGTLLTSLTVVNRVVTSHVYILAFPAW